MKLLGMPYPITQHPLGYFHTQAGVAQIKSDLLVLLLTNPGERVMTPEYGTPLRRLLFDQLDAATAEAAREAVIDAIARWEPRIAVEAVETDLVEDENLLKISIQFRNPQNIKDIEVLDLELPTGGA